VPFPPAARRSVAAAFALTLIALATMVAPPAQAAFAGRNGLVTYDGRWSGLGLISLRKPNGTKLRQIRVPGQPVDPTFSPLGRRIAFTTNGQIWAMYADGTGQRQVTAGPLPASSPAWSPNGEQLAFVGGATGTKDIYRIAADGTGLERLTRTPADDDHPAWSVGNRIAFVRRTPRRGGDIRTMGPNGRTSRPLTYSRADDEYPSWSPDGHWVAFTRGTARRRDVYVIRRDRTHLERLTRLKQAISSPAWSPDGRWLAFSMGRAGHRALYRVRVDGRGKPRRVASGSADAATVDWQAKGADPVIAAAGDIACDPSNKHFNAGLGTARYCHMRQTSDLLLKMDLSAVLAIGDTQYQTGAANAFALSFTQSWGRVKSLIRPAVGNHEAKDPGAAGYYDYFNGPGVLDGPAGRRGEGWYSFNLGSWHLIALNTECQPSAPAAVNPCAPGSPQDQWLRADLATHPQQCTLAYFHHPLTSSGIGNFNTPLATLWRDLQAAHVDAVVVGHDHAYERFAPLDYTGAVDPVNGIRQFVVGTGGNSLNHHDHHKAGSQLRESSVYGVLAMTLGRGFLRWQFVPEAHRHFTDEGTQRCH
jgi:Calcineurin-like phosphoesterase/WD40-like Beta Propeller Repeat